MNCDVLYVLPYLQTEKIQEKAKAVVGIERASPPLSEEFFGLTKMIFLAPKAVLHVVIKQSCLKESAEHNF